MPNFNADELQALVNELSASGLAVSKQEFNQLAAEVKAAAAKPEDSKPAPFSITRAIRGESARQGRVINDATRAEDIAYAEKTLVTGATPGSYLVPTIQSADIIEILGQGGVLRRSGARVWPLVGVQKLTIPTETAEPTVAYKGQDAAISPSDPNLSQIAFDLKERGCLVPLPNQLLRVSVPSVDAVVTRLIGKAFAKHEDKAFFQGIVGGPVAVQDVVGGTDISQAGAALAYSDLLNVLANFSNVEGEGPTAWYIHPLTFFNRVLYLRDNNNQLLIQPDSSTDGVLFRLFGSPVWLSVRIPTNLGSPAQKSYILYTNPDYIHVADSGAVEIAVSSEFYFNKNQTAIRGIHLHDFGYGPPAGVVLLTDVQ